jgi:hypothetical protein
VRAQEEKTECGEGGTKKARIVVGAAGLDPADSELGCVSAVGCSGRTIWIADVHRDAKRFIVRADEKLTAFLELEAAIRGCGFSRLDNLTRFFQTRRR